MMDGLMDGLMDGRTIGLECCPKPPRFRPERALNVPRILPESFPNLPGILPESFQVRLRVYGDAPAGVLRDPVAVP